MQEEIVGRVTEKACHANASWQGALKLCRKAGGFPMPKNQGLDPVMLTILTNPPFAYEKGDITDLEAAGYVTWAIIAQTTVSDMLGHLPSANGWNHGLVLALHKRAMEEIKPAAGQAAGPTTTTATVVQGANKGKFGHKVNVRGQPFFAGLPVPVTSKCDLCQFNLTEFHDTTGMKPEAVGKCPNCGCTFEEKSIIHCYASGDELSPSGECLNANCGASNHDDALLKARVVRMRMEHSNQGKKPRDLIRAARIDIGAMDATEKAELQREEVKEELVKKAEACNFPFAEGGGTPQKLLEKDRTPADGDLHFDWTVEGKSLHQIISKCGPKKMEMIACYAGIEKHEVNWDQSGSEVASDLISVALKSGKLRALVHQMVGDTSIAVYHAELRKIYPNL